MRIICRGLNDEDAKWILFNTEVNDVKSFYNYTVYNVEFEVTENIMMGACSDGVVFKNSTTGDTLKLMIGQYTAIVVA